MSNLNLFDLSPRELTNSAVWIWILDGLRSPASSMRKEIAVRLLQELKVPVPEVIKVLKTEHSLPDGRRIDVYLEGESSGKPFIFFIENKVSHDASVDSQVAGYLDALANNEQPIYSAVLSLHPGIQQLIKNSSEFTKNNRPAVFDMEQMIGLFSCFDLPEESIPAEFLQHLITRKEQFDRVSSAITRGGADPEMWFTVARQNGVEDLFAQYIDLASGVESSSNGQLYVEYFKSKSVAVLNKSKQPILSLQPKKSTSASGLKLGYNSVNWLKHFDSEFPIDLLPADFADDPISGQANWHFGYFSQPEDLSLFFSAFGYFVK